MKVLLLIPSEVNYIEASATERVDRQREHRPKLGILYVASYLEKNRPEYELRVLDASSEGYSTEEQAERITEFNPDVVGLSAMTFNLLDALAAARRVKQIKPKARVVIGGWHATHYPLETLKQSGVDYVVHGEGELTFAELCDRLADALFHPSLQDLEGIAYRKADGEIVLNPPRPLVEDLNQLPMPNYNLVNIGSYQHILGRKGGTLSLQSSRGCPFGCAFCDIRRTKFRQRSSESVVAEIRRWYNMGIRSFFFVDDNFVINKKWMFETCEMIARQGLEIEFKISARVDQIDSEMYHQLSRTGCSRVNFGVESSKQKYLDYLNKGITVEQTVEAFRLIHQAGGKGFAYMIIGFPEQSLPEMYEELAFLHNIKADFASFAVLSAYPKTVLYQRLLNEGIFANDFWQEFAENPRPDFIMPLVSKRYTRQQLRKVQVRITQLFYFNPMFFLRAATSIRSLSQLKNYSKMALKIARGVS